MNQVVLGFVLVFVVQAIFLSAALWLMLKLQKIEYNLLGLLVVAAAASALDLIPDFGHYIAAPVLLFGIIKVTGADVTDVIFTVMISYALTFCMNLFLIGALIGDLRPSAVAEDWDDDIIVASRDTPKVEVQRDKSDEEPKEVPATNSVALAASGPQATNNTRTVLAAAKTNQPPAQTKTSVVQEFSLRGTMPGSKMSLAMVHSGVRVYTIAVGESLSMKTSAGDTAVVCEKVNDTSVVLNIAGEQVELFLRQ